VISSMPNYYRIKRNWRKSKETGGKNLMQTRRNVAGRSAPVLGVLAAP